jgi:(heptosyl)LPS beta-1,4-glucosyltransferase
MAHVKVSAVVNTLNEAHNIDYCLRSLRPWVDELIVVDMHSDDATQEIARGYADVLLEHERVGFVEPARAKGLAAATGDWIMIVDADEVVTPKLAAWIRGFVDSDPEYGLVRIPRANVFLGQWLRSTRWWPGKPRLFRRELMETSDEIHRGLIIKPDTPVATLPKDPELSLWHFTRQSLAALTEKTNHYTTIEARQAIAADKPEPRARHAFMAALRSIGKYVVRGVHRDGMAGLAYAMDRAYYKWLAQMKRWDERHAGSRQQEYDQWRDRILVGFENWDAEAALPTGAAVAGKGHGRSASRRALRSAKRLVRGAPAKTAEPPAQ